LKERLMGRGSIQRLGQVPDQIHDRNATIRGSHGGRVDVAGSGAAQPPPIPQNIDPRR